MKCLIAGFLFTISISFVFAQDKNRGNEFSLMFYNVENFFDCVEDSLVNDDEFTPTGDRKWSFSRFNAKADRLAKVILAAGKWNPPALVGLCEVENQNALEMLTRQTPLRNYNYKIIHKDSPDERGIDVALIYRPDLFRPLNYQAIPLTDPEDLSFRTREILLVSGVLFDCDTIHVFVNHWPSRYGGVMETIKYRKLAAHVLKAAVQNLLSKYSNPNIICMGDFNDTPEDESIMQSLNAVEKDDSAIDGELVNLSYAWMKKPVQTLKNMYSWLVFDQLIVSDFLLGGTHCFENLSAEIFDTPFLLETDKKYGGVKPKRTYVGFKYQEGFSDHLPVLLRFVRAR